MDQMGITTLVRSILCSFHEKCDCFEQYFLCAFDSITKQKKIDSENSFFVINWTPFRICLSNYGAGYASFHFAAVNRKMTADFEIATTRRHANIEVFARKIKVSL